MIIDFHTHTFPAAIERAAVGKLEQAAGIHSWLPATNEELISSMEKANVDYSVILPVVTGPKQTATINDSAVRLNEKFGGQGLISFGGIHPADENYRETLSWIASHGLKGIKLHPVYQRVAFDDIACMRIVDYAGELGLIVSVHGGIDIGVPGDQCSPERFARVIDTVHPEKLVLAHLGGWNQFDLVEELLVGKDVWLDTSFAIGRPYRDVLVPGTELPDLCDEERFVRMVRNHGAERFLFGTDSPWSSQSAEIEKIRQMGLSEAEKSMILGENAAKLLNL